MYICQSVTNACWCILDPSIGRNALRQVRHQPPTSYASSLKLRLKTYLQGYNDSKNLFENVYQSNKEIRPSTYVQRLCLQKKLSKHLILNKSSLVRSYLRLSGTAYGDQSKSIKNLVNFAVGNLSKVQPLSRLLINCLLVRSKGGHSRVSTNRMCHISESSISYVGRLCSLSRQNLYYGKV